MFTENKRVINFQICKGKKWSKKKESLKSKKGKKRKNPQNGMNRIYKMAERKSNTFFKITINVKQLMLKYYMIKLREKKSKCSL